MSQRTLLTVAFVAKYFGVTPRTIRNWIGRGLFPAYQIPGTRGVRLDLDEVNKAMQLVPTARASFGPNAHIVTLPPQARTATQTKYVPALPATELTAD